MRDLRIILFFDRNTGGRTLKADLVKAGIDVVLHDEMFSQNTKDHEWLEVIAKHGYPIITGDKRTAKDLLFLSKLESHPARVFILLGINHGTPQDRIKCVLEAKNKLMELVKECDPPVIWSVSKDCKSARKVDHQTILRKLRLKSRR